MATAKQLDAAARMNWIYISGFFDGEGGVTVVSKIGSEVLTLKATIGQRSLEVLLSISAFLRASGIHSAVYASEIHANVLEIRRVDDLIRFLRMLKPIVKRRQVEIALDYLRGRISGNALLELYALEYGKHKRKGNPKARLGLRFPLTRFQAIESAATKSAHARESGSERSFLTRMRRRVLSMPSTFDVKDIQRVIGVSKSRAQVIGRLMVERGLVTCNFERVPPRFRKLVFARV